MTQKISITRALVELKRYDQRIAQALNAVFVARVQGRGANRKVVGTQDTVTASEAKIKGNFDKVDALIANRAALKSAIVLSNATVKVKVLGREVSVAEAIELKTSVNQRQQYLGVLRSQNVQTKQYVEKANIDLQTKIDVSLNNIYGSDKAKVTSEMVAMVSDPQKDQYEQSALDPSGIEARIEKLQAEILEVESELDFILSESNARTEIEVEI